MLPRQADEFTVFDTLLTSRYGDGNHRESVCPMRESAFLRLKKPP